MQTIVALATPAGNSGVAVIRISGDKAKSIGQQLIKQNLNFEPRKMYLKDIYVNGIVDKCLVVYFAAPNSFTGEDVVEIQSHGGYFLVQEIIDATLSFGAIPAGAGEFSKRAFVNGKMSLDQAEGIMDLINSESELQLKAGSNLVNGELTANITKLQDSLTDTLAEIEAKIDYPEYEFTKNETTNLANSLTGVKNSLKTLISDSESGQIIKNGIKVAIVGAPNVGKSSLLNALTNSDKAIVTDVAGTTRDIVEGEYLYKGIVFKLWDTAGIHESVDIVEKIGIERAKNTIKDADLVIKMSDANNFCDISTDKPSISVLNKIDINKNVDKVSHKFDIEISAKNNLKIDELKELIFNKTVKQDLNKDKFYLTNSRHIQCVKSALQNIENSLNLINNSSLDLVAHEIKSAWLSLGDVTGQTSDETIIDSIFSKFCLGK